MDARPLRDFINITETLSTPPAMIEPQPVVFEPPLPAPSIDQEIQEQIEHLVFKLRGYQDPDMGEYSAGVEAGMDKAADMVQNLLNRLRGT